MSQNDTVESWQKQLRGKARPEKIEILSSFFKTAPGQYGCGDTFLGISVPENRSISRHYCHLSLDAIDAMLSSPIHEFRLAGFLALVEKYKKSKNRQEKDTIVDFYLSSGTKANNWDLVDLSAPYILGTEIATHRYTETIDLLIESGNLWLQRIAMVSMLNPVMKKGDVELALTTAGKLVSHPHDLMRKAVGWVLREVGKKDLNALRNFLSANISSISATTLSYATEKLTAEERHHWRSLRKGSTAAKH